MVWVPDGAFLLGLNEHYPEEAPAHQVTVDGCWMDKHTVTNAQFSRFVEETDYMTLAEWEFAARGVLEGAEFAWGDELAPEGKQMANLWQGEFPHENLLEDGYESSAPVESFPPNGYGLFEMMGNVWEWTTDWYQEHSQITNSCCGSVNPKGGACERSYDPCVPSPAVS
jgi:formylglycine-generating enzyme required for sulfatase activity